MFPEPKGQTRYNLREIYEYKLKLLEQKNKAQAMVLKANAANMLNENRTHSNVEREQISDVNSRRSSDVGIIKVTVEGKQSSFGLEIPFKSDLKPKSPLQQPLLIQTAN